MLHDDLAEYEQVAAEILRSPNGSIFNGDIRKTKLAMSRQSTADCFIYGSSHAMGFSAANWPALRELGCAKTLNAGVYYGAFEDFVILSAVALEKPALKTLVVGFSPWMVHWRSKNGLYRSISQVHEMARTRLGLAAGKYPDDPASGLEPDAQLRNFRFYIEHGRLSDQTAPAGKSSVRFIEVNEDRSNVKIGDDVIRADGSRVRSVGNIEQLRSNGLYFDGSVLGAPNINAGIVDETRSILRMLQENGKRLAFLLTPYSPQVWECRPGNMATCNALVEVEAAVRDMAREFGIEIYGSYDARTAGVNAGDFLDGQHISDEANRKVVRTF